VLAAWIYKYRELIELHLEAVSDISDDYIYIFRDTRYQDPLELTPQQFQQLLAILNLSPEEIRPDRRNRLPNERIYQLLQETARGNPETLAKKWSTSIRRKGKYINFLYLSLIDHFDPSEKNLEAMIRALKRLTIGD
jgi:hypothetical protein